jgi:hypothetical protein
MSNKTVRRYLTHDCDQARVELVLQSSGNGDWYLSIVREGQKFNRLAPVDDELLPPPAVIRIVTHGERKEHTHVGAAIAGLWRALGGEVPSQREQFLEEDIATLRASVQAFSVLTGLANTPRKQILERLAAQKWPIHLGRPGERVLLLAMQGFLGVERKGAARQVESMVDGCQSDAEALEVLGGMLWNELADLPFPIRDLLGIDEQGNWIDEFPKSEDSNKLVPKLTLDSAMRTSERDSTNDLSHRWCTLIFREGGQEPSTIGLFEQENAARRAFSSWSAQWSESYLCEIVDGPKRCGAPGGDRVVDISGHEWVTPPVYGPSANTIDGGD